MRKILFYLTFLIISALLLFSAFQITIFKKSDQYILVKTEGGDISVFSTEKTFILVPELIRQLRQPEILKLSQREGKLSFKSSFALPSINILTPSSQMELKVDLFISYSLNPKRFNRVIKESFFGGGPEGFIRKNLSDFLSINFYKFLENKENFKKIMDAEDFFKNLLHKWKEDIKASGTLISSIEPGTGNNFQAVRELLKNTYFSPEMAKLRKETALRKAKEKADLATRIREEKDKSELQDRKLEQELYRLEKYARFLKKFPEAYKILFLEKIDKNSKIIIIPNSISNELGLVDLLGNLSKDKSPRTKDQKQDSQKEKTLPRKDPADDLGPGKFLSQ